MKRDQVIFDIIEKEHQRQLKGVELIASENFVSENVLKAAATLPTNTPRAIPRQDTTADASMLMK